VLANHKGEIPFVVLILPFLLGITVGLSFWQITYLTLVLTSLLLFGITFVILNLNYARFGLYKVRWIGGSLITLILFLTGWFSVIQYNELNSDKHFSKTPAQYLLIKINNEPTIKNGLVRFTAKVEQRVDSTKHVSISSGTLLVSIKDTLASKLYYGDEILIPATDNVVDPPFNPAEFNYKKYLANQNIYHQIFLYPGQYRVLTHNAGNPIIAYSLRLRQRLVEKLKLNMRDTSAIAVASTLILGYKADLSNEILQAYSKTGTIHILSVSGGHVAVIYLLLNILFGFLGRYKHGKVIKPVLIISLIWYYAMITGFSPAVCRAAVMISLIIIGKTYSRYINTLNILAFSAFALLLYDPLFITDVGFQLSYLAVAGLIVFQPLVYKWLTFKNKWVNKLWAACSVSIAAQVITFPLSALYFHQFPVYFLVSNLFILIPAEIILCVGMAYLVLPQIPVVSVAMAWVLERSILLMNKVLTFIEHIPFASINKIWLTSAEYIMLCIVIICLFYFFYNKKSWLLKLGLGLTLLLAISVSAKRLNLFNADSITVLNMRKHLGIVFKHGDKAIILTDISPTDKNYQYAVQPYLDSCKITDTIVSNLKRNNIKTTFLQQHNNLIQFNNQKILVFNRTMLGKKLPEKLKVDYLYIAGNPHISIKELNTNYDYKTLLIDGSNTDKLVTNLSTEAKKIGINYKVIKRNNSLIVVSN
jgi:competence protein ComEC